MQEQSFGIIPIYRSKDQTLYLLLKHKAGHWAFPKGHANLDETEQETALRELFEETGIHDCQILQTEPLTEHYQYLRQESSQKIEKIVKYWIGEILANKVTIQKEEITEYKLLPLDQAIALATFPTTQNILKIADQIVSGL